MVRKTLKRRTSTKKVRMSRRKTVKKVAGKRHRRSLRGGATLQELEQKLEGLYGQTTELEYKLGELMADKAPKDEINAKKAEIEKVQKEIAEVEAEIERMQPGRLDEIAEKQRADAEAEQDPYY